MRAKTRIAVLTAFVICASLISISCTTAPCLLRGILASITLSPSSATMDLCSTQTFTATALCTSGTAMTFTPVWSVSGGIGTVDSSGKFTASAVGDGYVRVTRGYVYSGCISGEARIKVIGGGGGGSVSVLTSIVVSPDPKSLKVGEAQAFAAIGYDQFGNVMAINPVWAVDAAIGNVMQTGAFTATNVGNGNVTATDSGVSGLAVVTVEADASGGTTFVPDVTTILVLPTSESICVTESLGYIAYCYDQKGNIMDYTPTWSVSGGVGTVASIGVFTATAEGSGKVRASAAAAYGEGSITVSP